MAINASREAARATIKLAREDFRHAGQLEWCLCVHLFLTAAVRGHLEPIVGVDPEAQNGRDAHGLIVAHGGLKFPAPQRREDFGGHVCRAGFKHAYISDIS